MAEIATNTNDTKNASEKRSDSTLASTRTETETQSNAEQETDANLISNVQEDKTSQSVSVEKKCPPLERKPSTKEKVLNVLNKHLKIYGSTIEPEEEEKLPIPNQCTIKNLTYDIQKDLMLLQKKYSSYQPLIYRTWKTKNLRIMQFNMCADGLIGIYKKEKDEKTFLGIDKKCLEWTYRGLKILEIILEHDCDIICLQECDNIEFFGKYLEKYGYEWIFQPKNESPIKKVELEIQKDRNDNNIKMNIDGVVIIYKKNKLKKKDDPIFIDMTKNEEKINGLAVSLTYSFKKNFNNLNLIINIDLLIIVTHPKSTKDEEGEKLRERQLKLLLTKLIPKEQFENKFIILSCDLNSSPIFHNQNKDPLCYSYVTKDFQFQSCYKLFSNDQNEPEFTTLKKRESGISKNCLDYIFVKNNANNIDFDVVGCLDIPASNNKDNGDLLLPNWYYPSDHFALVSEISFLPIQQ